MVLSIKHKSDFPMQILKADDIHDDTKLNKKRHAYTLYVQCTYTLYVQCTYTLLEIMK